MRIKRRVFRGCYEDEICFMVATTGTTSRNEFFKEILRFIQPDIDENENARLSAELVFSYSNRNFRIWFFDSEYDDGTNRGSSAFSRYIHGAKYGLIIINLSKLDSIQGLPEIINQLRVQREFSLMILGIQKEDLRILPSEEIQELALKYSCTYRELQLKNNEDFSSLIGNIVNFVIESDEQINEHFRSYSNESKSDI